jgi:prolyl oligopeptidase
MIGALALGLLMSDLTYPVTRRSDFAETLHGISMPDPYRWLEDDNSDETKLWVKAQNKVTFEYLDNLPDREKIKALLSTNWQFDSYSAPSKQGKHYFYGYSDGITNQPLLYVTDDIKKEGRVLMDPNKLSSDGTVALGSTSVSPDGKKLAYSLQRGGSDWQEWKVRDVATGKDTEDYIQWSKFSGAGWTKDSKGFYYSRYDAPKPGEALSGANFFQKLYFHKLGTPQSDDPLIYQSQENKEWGFGASESEDGRYLIISVSKGTFPENQILYRDNQIGGEPQFLFKGFDAGYTFLGNDGQILYFSTDKDAPNKRIVSVDLRQRNQILREVVSESKEPLESASIVGDTLFCSYLADASTKVVQFDLKTRKVLREVKLPGIGSAGGFDGRREDKETFYTYSSYNSPSAVYHLDVQSGKSKLWKRPKLGFDPGEFVVERVFYRSFDGTKIPLFLVHKKGLKRDGENPTLLYAYGGFNIAVTPRYSKGFMGWLQIGGTLAVACIRGGSEYGNAWHDSGKLFNKKNCFKDFIAAAEYLIAEKITSPKKLAIEGASNGGLLVGATLNMRPDLFGAALPGVGVMDMLRFHKFTIGWAWASDYGSPDDPKDFEYLRSYSPYHNIVEGGKYPAVLVTTGDHDDRVVPAHSFKYTAALQRAQSGPAPVLIRIETSGGHGGGKPTSKVIDETADSWAFLAKNLDFKPKL